MQDTILSITAAVLDVIAVVAVLLSERRQPSATLAWILAVIFLPVVGIALYVLFGGSRLKRVAARSAASAARVEAVLELHKVADKLSPSGVAPPDERTQDMLRLGRRVSSTAASRGNRVKLLVNAAATYRAMANAIEHAKHHVHVEFYIIQPDRFGVALRDRLTRRAEQGVQVRVLCDAIGSMALPVDFWLPLREAGGEASTFRPVWRFANRFRRRDRIDFRNHRKIVVVDGRVSFTGGINVGREYLGLDPDIGRWRDTHVLIEGPATLSLQQAFAEDWHIATGRLLEDAEHFPDPPETHKNPCVVQVVDSGPDRAWSPISSVFSQAFALSRQRLWITSPYFIPNATILDMLVTAALREVDVRLLVPRRADSMIVTLASRSYYRDLLEAGVRVFEYERGFVHAKTIVVDDWMATVGSANMDMRSFHLNFELNALIFGGPFVDELGDQFLADLKHAREIPCTEERTLGSARRVLRSGARLLSPLL